MSERARYTKSVQRTAFPAPPRRERERDTTPCPLEYVYREGGDRTREINSAKELK